jgi:hypothetical protein
MAMTRQHTSLRSVAVITLGVVVAAAFAACGGSDASPPATAPVATQTSAAASPTPAVTTAPTQVAGTPDVGSPTPSSRPSGIADVDAAIDAVLSGDAAGLARLVEYRPVACVVNPQGLGAPPNCIGDETNGTPVDVLAVAQCEGGYTRPPADLQPFITGGEQLYAVYDDGDSFLGGPYVAVFSYPAPAQQTGHWARALFMDDTGITGVHYGCAQTPEQFVEFNRLASAIVPPK